MVGWQLGGALIEKSMSICASSSPGWLPACLKSPNEAWSRYLIPHLLCQSDFVAEVIPLVSSPPLSWGLNVFASPFHCVRLCGEYTRSVCGTAKTLDQHSTDMSCWEHQSEAVKEHCLYCHDMYHPNSLIYGGAANTFKEHCVAVLQIMF